MPVPAAFEVLVGDISLGVFQPATASYTEYATPPFRVSAKSAQVRFVARNRDGSEITALLDNVRIVASAPTVGADIRWLVTDHLGTPRMVVGLGGQLADVTRHDYLPFGEEAGMGVGNGSVRGSGNGYGGDSVRMKFTGKERDAETGLDFFSARYFSSIQGRFISPDEFQGGPLEVFLLGSGDPEKQALPYADIFEPQSLNKYQYCLNNPLRYVGPYGHQQKGQQEKSTTEKLKEGAAEVAGGAKDASVGMAKGAANAAIEVNNAVNDVADTLISPFTNFRFGHLPKFEPSNPNEAATMNGMALAMVFLPGTQEVKAEQALQKGATLISGIGKDKTLVKLAEEAGASVQKGIDALTTQLGSGNLNPGIGSKNLFGNISYARTRDGARVFFRKVGDQVEILAKASKENEQAVINRLKKLYEE